ncbi:MAG TPA: ketosynthase [Lysobacter sp.]|nr:ketosynthase [Lysobacter sp.]
MNRDGALALARVALAVAYPVLAHLASARDSGALAAFAVVDIALILLLPALARSSWRAWVALAVVALVSIWLAQTHYAQLPLLLVPVLFVGLVAWAFARTLRAGRVPLIARIVSALEAKEPAQLEPEIARYTRSLTGVWAAVLAALAAVNLVLALLAVPGGLLASFGIATPWPVDERLWSWCANGATYGLIGGLMVAEFAWRSRRFPGRDGGPLDFARRMVALGPGFWNGLFRNDPRR